MYDLSYIKSAVSNLNPQGKLEIQVKFALKALKQIEPYTAFHSYRVGSIAKLIAVALKLEAKLIDQITAGGMLHDIGKSGVSISALLKTTSLNEDEYEDIKRHPEIGADLAQTFPLFIELVPAIRYHHERFDGAGYPVGLKGDSIPLEARVIAVADTYDAVTSNRSYRSARSHDEALKILRAGSGSQFDPKVIDALMSCEHTVKKDSDRLKYIFNLNDEEFI